MSKNHWRDSWLSFGLAFVGGYCDAGGYVLAKTFTGHITGTLVLAAISLAGHDWRTLLRLWFAKTLADFEINDIAASRHCYSS